MAVAHARAERDQERGRQDLGVAQDWQVRGVLELFSQAKVRPPRRAAARSAPDSSPPSRNTKAEYAEEREESASEEYPIDDDDDDYYDYRGTVVSTPVAAPCPVLPSDLYLACNTHTASTAKTLCASATPSRHPPAAMTRTNRISPHWVAVLLLQAWCRMESAVRRREWMHRLLSAV